ncbi:hypothetical protein NMY22_g6927 [Coprinellus aureogranulatus]|nr:hypothetical protein NMY22_g6927 [Coprinellus aureogranulatus]
MPPLMARRSTRLRAMAERLPFTRAVWQMPELLAAVVCFADWPTLVSITRVNREGMQAARFEIRCRISFVVQPFIPRPILPSFFDEMVATGFAITGSVAWYMLQYNREWYTTWLASWYAAGFPRPTPAVDLNILVPQDHWYRVLQWFLLRGYHHPLRFPVGHAYRSFGVLDFVGLHSPSSPNQFFHGITITLSLCRKSIVHPAFASSFSTQANLITSSQVITPLPALCERPICLRNCRHPFNSPSVRIPASYEWEPSNAHWTTPCGRRCPALDRNQPRHGTVKSFTWSSPDAVPQHDRLILRQARSSRLPGHYRQRCYNHLCPNHAPWIVDIWRPSKTLL